VKRPFVIKIRNWISRRIWHSTRKRWKPHGTSCFLVPTLALREASVGKCGMELVRRGAAGAVP